MQKIMQRLADLNVEDHVEIDERLFRPHEVPLLLGDPSKAHAVLGWKPKYNLKLLVKDMYHSDFEMVEKAARSKMMNISPSAYITNNI